MSNPFVTTTDSGWKQYFHVPYLIIGASIAVIGTMAIKLVGGLLTPKAK